MSEFDDWHTEEVEDRLFYLEPIDIAEEAFTAGRKLQREKDAVLCVEVGQNGGGAYECATAIREQEIE